MSCQTAPPKRSSPGSPRIQKFRWSAGIDKVAFADAVSQVLPHATQVADRYHLIQNLREHLQQFLDRKRTCLPFVEDTALKSPQASPKEKAASPSELALGASSDPAAGRLPS